jgi:hypothetical protein
VEGSEEREGGMREEDKNEEANVHLQKDKKRSQKTC